MDTVGGSAEEHLVELERSLLHPGRSTDVGALLADDFVEVGASGRRWNRAAVIDLVEARRDDGVGEYELDEVDCRPLGGGAHLLIYAIRTGHGRTRRASVWEVVDGRWQLVYHQGTPVPD